jgi:hypothetical protein
MPKRMSSVAEATGNPMLEIFSTAEVFPCSLFIVMSPAGVEFPFAKRE